MFTSAASAFTDCYLVGPGRDTATAHWPSAPIPVRVGQSWFQSKSGAGPSSSKPQVHAAPDARPRARRGNLPPLPTAHAQSAPRATAQPHPSETPGSLKATERRDAHAPAAHAQAQWGAVAEPSRVFLAVRGSLFARCSCVRQVLKGRGRGSPTPKSQQHGGAGCHRRRGAGCRQRRAPPRSPRPCSGPGPGSCPGPELRGLAVRAAGDAPLWRAGRSRGRGRPAAGSGPGGQRRTRQARSVPVRSGRGWRGGGGGGRGRPAGHLRPPGRRREHSQFGGSGGRGDPLGGRGRRRGSPETGQRWRRRRRPEQDLHVRGLQRDHESGGQAAQAVDVQEAPQQDVQGQIQEKEKRPGPELRWGRRVWQLRKRQTGGKCRQHTLHCKTKNGIFWRSTCKTYSFRTSVKSKKTVITKKSRSGTVFTETAAAIKSASFGAKTTAVSRNISVREFIKKIYMFFYLIVVDGRIFILKING